MVSNRPTGHSGTTVHDRTRQPAIMRPATGLNEDRAACLWTRTLDAVAATDPRGNRPPDRTVAVLRRSRRQHHPHSSRHPRSAYRPSRLSPKADAKAPIPIAPNRTRGFVQSGFNEVRDTAHQRPPARGPHRTLQIPKLRIL
jgi:hypothetical protein